MAHNIRLKRLRRFVEKKPSRLKTLTVVEALVTVSAPETKSYGIERHRGYDTKVSGASSYKESDHLLKPGAPEPCRIWLIMRRLINAQHIG
jgi:hypothetical protein